MLTPPPKTAQSISEGGSEVSKVIKYIVASLEGDANITVSEPGLYSYTLPDNGVTLTLFNVIFASGREWVVGVSQDAKGAYQYYISESIDTPNFRPVSDENGEFTLGSPYELAHNRATFDDFAMRVLKDILWDDTGEINIGCNGWTIINHRSAWFYTISIGEGFAPDANLVLDEDLDRVYFKPYDDEDFIEWAWDGDKDCYTNTGRIAKWDGEVDFFTLPAE